MYTDFNHFSLFFIWNFEMIPWSTSAILCYPAANTMGQFRYIYFQNTVKLGSHQSRDSQLAARIERSNIIQVFRTYTLYHLIKVASSRWGWTSLQVVKFHTFSVVRLCVSVNVSLSGMNDPTRHSAVKPIRTDTAMFWDIPADTVFNSNVHCSVRVDSTYKPQACGSDSNPFILAER